MKDKLFVIIVTYNGAQWIERCLESVIHSTYKCIPVIIDNGSSDNTLAIIKSKYPQAILLDSGGNVGFGRGNNIGIQYAIEKGAEFVYLLNQDAWVDNNVFDTLIKLMKEYPEYAIISPVQITENRKSIDANFKKFDIDDKFCPTLKEDLLLKQLKPIYEIPAAMAAHWMLRLSAIRDVGQFSEAFPHYGEDGNLIHRLKYFGYRVGLCPTVFGVHDREERPMSPSKKVYMCYITSIIYFHNINDCGLAFKYRQLLRLFLQILGETNAPLIYRISYMFKIITVPFYSRKYRKLYLQGKWKLD